MKNTRLLLVKTFIIATLLTFCVISMVSHLKMNHLAEVLASKEGIITNIINTTLMPSKILARYQSLSDNDLTEEEFNKIAKTVYSPARYAAFVLLKDDKTLYVYPSEFNSDSIGLDFFENESLSNEADFSMINNAPFFSGPFKFIKSQNVLLVFVPIHVYNEKSVRTFWGFMASSVLIPEIFTESCLFSSVQGIYEYKFSIATNTNKSVVSESADFNSYLSLSKTISYENLDIEFALSYNFLDFINIPLYFFTFIVFLSLCFFAFYFFLPYNKRFFFKKQKEHIDILTNVYNKNKLLDYIYLNEQKEKKPFALIYIDINNFSNINLTYGNHVGDNLLINFVDRIKKSIKVPHKITRIGADKFILIFENLYSNEQIRELEFSLLKLASTPFDFDENIVRIRARVSHAIYPNNGNTYTELTDFLFKKLPPKEG